MNIFTEETIIVDTETTGLNPATDELLQIAIIDGTGKTLFNEYIKPTQTKSWTEAEKIHGITPAKVKNCKDITAYKNQLSDIINNAKTIIGYNTRFDLAFLRHHIDIMPGKKIIDIMPIFAKIYGEKSIYNPEQYKYQKLSTAAAYYKYDYVPHNALNDVLATLHVAKNLL